MTTPKTQSTPRLALERTYPQSPEQVWAAWTDPQALRQWFFPADVPGVAIPKFDVRPGGEYRIEFAAGAAMEAHVAVGTFREVVPGRRLVFTWDWQGQPPMGSVVHVELEKAGNGTRLTLRHEGLPGQEAADLHRLGWNAILDRYALLLDPDANKAVVRRFIEQGAAKNDARVIEQTVAPDFVWHTPMPGAPPTRDGVRMAIAGFRQAFPDYRLTLLDVLGDGDKVASRVRFVGTNQGSMMGMPPTGKQVDVEFWHIERIVNGQIAERWNVIDNLAMMQQLGMVPGK